MLPTPLTIAPSLAALFLVEIPLDLIGFGFDFYLTQRFHWLHVLDAIVIIVAFCLEVAVDVRPALPCIRCYLCGTTHVLHAR